MKTSGKRKHATLSISDTLHVTQRLEREHWQKIHNFNIDVSTISNTVSKKTKLSKFVTGSCSTLTDVKKNYEVMYKWFASKRTE